MIRLDVCWCGNLQWISVPKGCEVRRYVEVLKGTVL